MTSYAISTRKSGRPTAADKGPACWLHRISQIFSASPLVACLVLAASSTILHAGEVDVLQAEINPLGDNRFRIDVTLKHADTGWDHYANKWVVMDESGNVIGTRELAHPHVDEQPFTRSLTLSIPEAVKTIVLRGYDSVHAEGGTEMSLNIPDR